MGTRARTLAGAYDGLIPRSFYETRKTDGSVIPRYHKGFQVLTGGTQYTESEGHPFPRKRSKDHNRVGKHGDVGGPFYTVKRYLLDPGTLASADRITPLTIPGYKADVQSIESVPLLSIPSSVFSTFPLDLSSFGGGIFTDGIGYRLSTGSFPSADGPDKNYDSLGTTAIARCKPTNSPADLSVAIGELSRDGLPSVVGSTAWKKDLNAARKAASEHLNYQFGIKPVISEIQTAAKTFRKMDDIVAQYERDAGRLVRRRYYFPMERSTSSFRIPAATTISSVIAGSPFILNGYGPIDIVSETRRSAWFSGAFTYTLPKGMNSRSILGEIRLKADRLGLDPDLDTIWNVAPWTWAVDWFSNTGDFVSNINDVAKYGLVVKYGYLMVHTIKTITYSAPGMYLRDTKTWGPGTALPSTTLVTEEKVRVRATPFGFGFDMSSLSGMQSSILAALGISRR